MTAGGHGCRIGVPVPPVDRPKESESGTVVAFYRNGVWVNAVAGEAHEELAAREYAASTEDAMRAGWVRVRAENGIVMIDVAEHLDICSPVAFEIVNDLLDEGYVTDVDVVCCAGNFGYKGTAYSTVGELIGGSIV